MRVDESSETEIGRRLREARTARNISAYRLAILSEVSPSYPNKVENGRIRQPGAEELRKMADVLSINLDWLISGRGAMDGDPNSPTEAA
jgi:transcriptional regulator with XRE-family HTH domain